MNVPHLLPGPYDERDVLCQCERCVRWLHDRIRTLEAGIEAQIALAELSGYQWVPRETLIYDLHALLNEEKTT